MATPFESTDEVRDYLERQGVIRGSAAGTRVIARSLPLLLDKLDGIARLLARNLVERDRRGREWAGQEAWEEVGCMYCHEVVSGAEARPGPTCPACFSDVLNGRTPRTALEADTGGRERE